MSKIIAFAGKGGVGKTTTAINLGASLAIAERRTLVLDCDPQSNATSGFGIRDHVGPAAASAVSRVRPPSPTSPRVRARRVSSPGPSEPAAASASSSVVSRLVRTSASKS